MLINDFVPFLVAQSGHAPGAKELLVQLPVEQDNAVLREAAFALFGRDAPHALLRDGLRRQGLLHLFHTYCLNGPLPLRHLSVTRPAQGIHAPLSKVLPSTPRKIDHVESHLVFQASFIADAPGRADLRPFARRAQNTPLNPKSLYRLRRVPPRPQSESHTGCWGVCNSS